MRLDANKNRCAPSRCLDQHHPGAADGHVELLVGLVLPGKARVRGGVRQVHDRVDERVRRQRRANLAPVSEICLDRRVVAGHWRTLIEQHERVFPGKALGDRGSNHASGPGDQHTHESTIPRIVLRPVATIWSVGSVVAVDYGWKDSALGQLVRRICRAAYLLYYPDFQPKA